MKEEQRQRMKLKFAEAGKRSALNKQNVSKSFYCLGDSFGESGKCDKQCEDCKRKMVKQ
jgi:hypothetical protein